MRRPLRTLTAAAALLAGLGVIGNAPGVTRVPRGLWLADARVLAAEREGGQQGAKPADPPPPPADQPPQVPPVFRAGINFVRVDVIVSDKNGEPVEDIQQADFEVTEDGTPQKIETFKLVTLDGGVVDSLTDTPKTIRTDSDEEMEAARDDVRLFAIFLDDYHVRRGASLSVRNQIVQFVETEIGPSDMIGVMYPLESTSSVRMTRNHSAVVQGLRQFLGRKYDYTPKNAFEERYSHYPTETVERVRNQVSLSAIKSLVVHMGSLKEGRKALVLVSEGYTNMVPPQLRDADAQVPGSGNPNTFNPFAGLDDLNEDRAAFMANMDLDADMRELYDAANRNNVAIYTVDPRGLPVFEFDINERVNGQSDARYLASTQDTLRALAENTDGRAIVNRNDLAAGMKQITRDSSAYYLIGYNSSQAPSDGKFHEIKVRVKRPGVQVRARRGYWALNREDTARALAPAPSAPAKPVEAALANLAVASRTSRTSVVRTWIGTSRGEDGRTRVTFVWEPIPAGGRTAAGEEPAWVTLTAVGPDGAPYFRGRVPSVPPPAATVGAPPRPPTRVTFDANPGTMQLRVSVEGAASQVLDTDTRDITIPDLTAAHAVLGTPQVFRARTVRDYQLLKADADAIPLPSREFSRTDRLLIRVPAYGPGGTTLVLNARLLNRAGSAMIDLQAGPSPNASEQQIELPLSGLAPGEYVIEVTAGDEANELVGFRVTG